ncbi:MAG: cyclase family protein [Chlamydiales bacterium]
MISKKFPFKIIDLTHTLEPSVPSWNGSCGFSHEIKLDYQNNKTEVQFRVQQIKMHAGIGTHIDAPSHCVPNGKCVADLDLNDLISPCVMIDVSKKAEMDYLVNLQDLNDFEKTYGTIAPGTFVIVHTGWDRFWKTPDKYRNNYHYPALSKEFAQQLLERHVSGIGVDTLSPDRPESGYPVHQLILGAGKYIVENVANAISLPAVSAYSIVMPIKTKDGTEAPIRLIALLESV